MFTEDEDFDWLDKSAKKKKPKPDKKFELEVKKHFAEKPKKEKTKPKSEKKKKQKKKKPKVFVPEGELEIYEYLIPKIGYDRVVNRKQLIYTGSNNADIKILKEGFHSVNGIDFRTVPVYYRAFVRNTKALKILESPKVMRAILKMYDSKKAFKFKYMCPWTKKYTTLLDIEEAYYTIAWKCLICQNPHNIKTRRYEVSNMICPCCTGKLEKNSLISERLKEFNDYVTDFLLYDRHRLVNYVRKNNKLKQQLMSNIQIPLSKKVKHKQELEERKRLEFSRFVQYLVDENKRYLNNED